MVQYSSLDMQQAGKASDLYKTKPGLRAHFGKWQRGEQEHEEMFIKRIAYIIQQLQLFSSTPSPSLQDSYAAYAAS